ncbi:MAG: enoyl-CoA hydratase-related protein [Pseudomonadota bacterium]
MSAPEDNTIKIEDKGDHLVVVSDNPVTKNALSLAYHAALLDALDQATREDRIAAVILVGRSGYFSAGGDLGFMLKSLNQEIDVTTEQIITELQDCVAAIRACPKPVIAAVTGGAAGGGFSIVMACDLVIVEEGAAFMPAYAKIGFTPDGGLTSTLARQLPHALASEICLFGAPVAAETLQHHGLVNRIVPKDSAEEEAVKMVAKLARGSVATQARIKALLVSGRSNDLTDQLALERQNLVEVLQSPAAMEGINSFLEKRRPDFPKAEGRSV